MKRIFRFLKRNWKVTVPVFILLSIISSIFGEEPVKETTTANTEESVEAESIEKESAEEKKEEKPKLDAATMELTSENVKSVVDSILGADEVEVLVEPNGDVSITYFKEMFWSAKSEVKDHAVNSTKIFEQLYKNPATNEVWISELGMVLDAKGNESKEQILGANTNRAMVEDVNWENMIGLVYSDYMNIQNITVGYTQSMAIQNELNK